MASVSNSPLKLKAKKVGPENVSDQKDSPQKGLVLKMLCPETAEIKEMFCQSFL